MLLAVVLFVELVVVLVPHVLSISERVRSYSASHDTSLIVFVRFGLACFTCHVTYKLEFINQ